MSDKQPGFFLLCDGSLSGVMEVLDNLINPFQGFLCVFNGFIRTKDINGFCMSCQEALRTFLGYVKNM